MLLRVPPDVEPRRVSVDAIEHWMIYREHPDVGAILHVHAWIEGTVATEINYPCGTVELAESVAELVAPGARPVARGRRPAQPRPHHHRPQPRRDLRPHRRPASSAKSPWTDSWARFSRSAEYTCPMNLRLRAASEVRSHRITRSGCRVAACHVTGSTRHPTAANSASRGFRLVPGAPVTVKRVSVALQRNLAVGPGEVEADSERHRRRPSADEPGVAHSLVGSRATQASRVPTPWVSRRRESPAADRADHPRGVRKSSMRRDEQ